MRKLFLYLRDEKRSGWFSRKNVFVVFRGRRRTSALFIFSIVVTATFLAAFNVVLGWTPPTAAPPANNVVTSWGAAGANNITNSNTGNVGIGVNPPVSKLQVANNVGTGDVDTYAEYQLLLLNSGVAATSYGVGIQANTLVFNSDSDYKFLRDGVAATPDLAIIAGNVGIGNAAPSTKLHVTGGARITGLVSCNTIDTNASGDLVCGTDETGAGGGGWTDGGTTVALTTITDNVGIGVTTPQTRLQVGDLTSGTGEATNKGLIQIQGNGGASLIGGGGLEFKGSPSTSGYGWQINAPDLGAGNVPLSFSHRANSAIWTNLVTFRGDTARVGIGDSNPQQKLHVAGGARITSLASCDTIDTNASGDLVCGTDASGGLSGGAANKVAFWTGASTLSNNTNFHWDNLNSRLGIGLIPSVQFQVSDTFRVGSTALAGLDYTRVSNDLYLGGDGAQDGNFYIKNNVGTTQVAINSDANSYFNGLAGAANVGIGTTAPGQRLELASPSGATPRLRFKKTAGTGGSVDMFMTLGDATSRTGTALCESALGANNAAAVCLAHWTALLTETTCATSATFSRALCAIVGD